MDHSNQNLRFNRTYHEATGKRIHSWEFDSAPHNADKYVFWSCVAIAAFLIIATIAGVQLGG